MQPEPNSARRLRAALDAAEPLLRAIADDESARPMAEGKWSPRQIIGHLIDSAGNNHQRFVRSALQDEMVFPPYAQEEWVAVQRYQDIPWPELLTLWLGFNRHLVHVMAAIPQHARERVRGKHNLDEIATYPPAHPAEATLEYFMLDYVDHLERHMRQILGDEWKA
jgi:hypothetical protein